VALALPALGCYPSAAPSDLTDGVWSGTDGDRQLVFEFVSSHIAVHARIHVLRDGRKLTEKPAEIVEFESPRLGVWWDGGRCYRGSIDFGRHRIDGEMTGAAGGPRELDLERVDPATVQGLRARPREAAGESYAWAPPPVVRDGWATASPEEVGMKRRHLEKTVSAILAGEAGEIHSLLVVRHGKLVLEEYFHGYARDDLHDVGSCTHCVASLLIGIAVDQGRIPSLSVPVLDIFSELRKAAARGWERVSLKHVLTMTTGWFDQQARPISVTEGSEALLVDTLARSPTHDPGTRWHHSDRNVNLLSGVLRRATGLQADEFAATFLFGPLGIEEFEWNRGPDGDFPGMHAGLRLRPRDMAKLGLLVLEEGRWQGRQVVSAEWIRESTSEQLDFLIAGDEQYGYLWWLPPLPESSGGGRVIAAWGRGSQFIYVSPSLDTVVTLTGGNQFNGKTFLPPRVLSRYLLPAFER
jgi:CubicO group peptidase (beta-lactamase class C family)